MEIRLLTPDYAVSGQITPADMAAIRAAGFTTVINNRPDGEIPGDLQTGPMAAAAAAAGLSFVVNPISSAATISDENVVQQRAAIAAADGPVFAYCASGNRSSVAWAMSQAGRRPTDEMIATAARWGYNLEQFRARIDGFATA